MITYKYQSIIPWAEKRFTMEKHAFIDMDHPSIQTESHTSFNSYNYITAGTEQQ